VLDACRNNPLRTPDTRSLGGTRGLAQAALPQGVFSIYSAGFGQEALDALGPDDRSANSIFTRVFVEKLKTRGLDLRAVATETRREGVKLRASIGHNQFPAYYDQTPGDVSLADLPAAAAAPKPALPPLSRDEVTKLFGPFDLAFTHVRDSYIEPR